MDDMEGSKGDDTMTDCPDCRRALFNCPAHPMTVRDAVGHEEYARIIRLSDLTLPQQRLVTALLTADAAAKRQAVSGDA